MMIPVGVSLKMSPSLSPSPSPSRNMLPSSHSHSRRYHSFPIPISIPNQIDKAKIRRGVWVCRAELPNEAPFALAIGASIFNTLLFTQPPAAVDEAEDEDEDEDDSSTSARFAVMSIISFIPFFNWLSWVFALTDTGKPRYAFYSLVYLVPYFRTNFSISPDDSWLPITSIVLCIIHIQLEASLLSGDLESFNFFNEIWKRLGFLNLKKDVQSISLAKKYVQRKPDNMKPPSAQHQTSDEITKWIGPVKPSQRQDDDHINEDDGTTD